MKENTMSIEIPITDDNGYWSGRLDELIERADGGPADQKLDAIEELRRMAKTADECLVAESELKHTLAELDAVGRQHDIARNRRLQICVAVSQGLQELGMLPAPADVDPEPEDPQNEQYKRMVACRDRLDRELREHARFDHGGSDTNNRLQSDARHVLVNIQRWIDEFEHPFIAWCAAPSRGEQLRDGRAAPNSGPRLGGM
jgi:hypothetical protein